MRKFLILVVGLMSLFSWLIYAQVTNTATVDFAILSRPPYDLRGLKYKAPYVAWKNNQGNVLAALRSDTTAMKAAYGSFQKAWIWTVKDTASVDASYGQITFRKMNWRSSGYTDTTLTVFKAIWTEIDGAIPYTLMNIAPFDSAYVGAQFTIAYVTTQFE